MPLNNRINHHELERKFQDRKAKTELAFKACAELVDTFSGVSPESSLYPAYNLARQALGLEKNT
jgi:hypothetical protein